MQDGEEITITYTASIDPEKASKILPVIGDEADGNSSKRGQAFRTNGALSPVLSMRSTALYR